MRREYIVKGVKYPLGNIYEITFSLLRHEAAAILPGSVVVGEFTVQNMEQSTTMISEEKALQIAKEYADKSERGWDGNYHEVTKADLYGEPVWMVSTSDIKYNDELSWMMEHFPNPVYYYISMVNGICIATGNRKNEVQMISRK